MDWVDVLGFAFILFVILFGIVGNTVIRRKINRRYAPTPHQEALYAI